jgi:hypothetical protein
MGIHADDILREIRLALTATGTARTQSQVRCYPRSLEKGETPTNTWRNRDGRLEFECVGRDWFRAFRVTVEAMPVEEFDEGDYSTEEWLIVPSRPSLWDRVRGWRVAE